MKKGNNIIAVIFVGIIFFLIGSIVLVANEFNAADNAKSVKEYLDVYKDVSNSNIDSNNNGKLVATNGKLVYTKVKDTTFNVTVDAPVFKRIVEMYQWKDKKNSDGTYDYDQVWSAEHIIGNTSEHQNQDFKYKSEDFYATSAKVGSFTLDSSCIRDMEAKLDLNSINYTYLPSGFKVQAGYITNSKDIENPKVGDIRISYKYGNYDEVSILGRQNGTTLTKYVSKTNNTVCKITKGIMNGNAVINNIKSSDNIMKWALRGLGTLALVIAIMALFSPITTAVGIFGSTVSNIVNLTVLVFALLLGSAESLIIIATSWLFVRPILSIVLFAVAIGLTILFSIFFEKKKA